MTMTFLQKTGIQLNYLVFIESLKMQKMRATRKFGAGCFFLPFSSGVFGQ